MGRNKMIVANINSVYKNIKQNIITENNNTKHGQSGAIVASKKWKYDFFDRNSSATYSKGSCNRI